MNPAFSAVDTFSRTVGSGSWGTTDMGQSWVNEASIASVDGTYGTIAVPASAAFRLMYIDVVAEGIAKQADASVLTMVRWSSSTAEPNTDFGLALNATSTNTFYFCSINDNWDQIELGVYINGVRWQINNGAMVVKKDTDYWMRYTVNLNGCYVKMWKVGTAEPSSWTLTSGLWDGAFPPQAGAFGIFYKGTANAYTAKFSALFYYTGDDTEPGLPAIDLFERTSNQSWGTSGGTAWQGNVGYDTDFYVRPNMGTVSDPGDGFANLTINETVSRYGLWGDRRATDAEVYTEFSINSSAGNTFFYVGLRGRLNPTFGSASPTGYGLYIATGASNISIRKCVNGTWGAALATSGAITPLVANTTYSVRFQITGGSSPTLRAKIWVAGGAEPAFQVTYADVSGVITASGSSWFELAQSVSTLRSLNVYRWAYQLPTATVTTTQTTTTNLTSSSITDNTLALRANFTGDTTGTNNTISVRYRAVSDTAWSTSNVVVGTRTTTYWPFTISGLTPATTYNVEVTYSDTDGVSGTNPITQPFTTTQTGMTTGVARITGVGASTINLEATYAGDTNNTSTASYKVRLSSRSTQIVNDTFSTNLGMALESHVPQVGSGWTKRVGATFSVNNNRAYVDFSTGGGSIYTANDTPSQLEIEVSASLRFDNYHAGLGVVARYNTSNGYCYIARYNPAASRWELLLRQATDTVLGFVSVALEFSLNYTMTLKITSTYKALFIDGVEVLRTTDNTLSAQGMVGIYATPFGTTEAPYATASIGDFLVTERVAGGAYGSAVAMTADRVNKKFTATASSLLSDAVYEIEVTYADADGLYGANTVQVVSGMTIGQGVQLNTLTFIPNYSTAVAYVNYSFDSNNNSSMIFQYRSTMDAMWITLPTSSVSVDRSGKLFAAVIGSLKSGMSYVVRATVSDPNGVLEGTPDTLTGQFTTLTNQTTESGAGKQYLWKVYDTNDNYVATWNDAGMPDFTWSLDSGLGDCTVELFRPYSSLTDFDRTLDVMYRVDVVVTAPSSSGVSPNLLDDRDFSQGMWTIGSNAVAQNTSGPDGGKALRLLATSTPVETLSENIFVDPSIPIFASVIAQAKGGQGKMQIKAYDSSETVIETSNSFGATVGANWQAIFMEYIPPRNTAFIRLSLSNVGAGTMYFARPFVSKKELLVYRGYVQSYDAVIDESGEKISATLYSSSTFLADDYVEWLQFVSPQPAEDAVAGRPNKGTADPSDMLKALIDLARQQNKRFSLYYTDTSIKQTGITTDYTFTDMTFQAAFEALLDLAPLDWHFSIDPDGRVSFFGPTTVSTHALRLGVEITDFRKTPNIREVKNYIVVYGSQDDDKKIKHITFDQPSIDIHGRKVDIYTDSGIDTEDTAELVADGRLAQFKDPSVAMEATLPDTNSIDMMSKQTLRGYAIEQLRVGDLITVTDPVAQAEDTLWDQFRWDIDSWDSNPIERSIVATPVPIKGINYRGDEAVITLAEHPPSVSKQYARLWKYTQEQDRKQRLGLV